MRFYNETQWNTAQLNALCRVVIERMGAQGVVRSIRCVYRCRDSPKKIDHARYGGTAHYGIMHITMKLPRCSHKCETVGEDGRAEWFDNRTIFSPTIFAQVLEHELSHLMGVREHKDMQDWWTLDTNYVHGYVVSARFARPNTADSLIKVSSEENFTDSRELNRENKIKE
jgi:hypothetical protein